jgi:hypothetical protein
MATPNTQDKPAPSVWGGQATEVLAGVEILDKAELLGKEFAITAIMTKVGSRDVSYVYLEGKFTPDGEPFQFNDSSSSGVRDQILSYLAKHDRADVLEEWWDLPVPILCPRGLRVSRYDKEVPNNRGGIETKKVATFYLTTSGERA